MDITTTVTTHNIEPGHNIVERSDDSEASINLDRVDMDKEQTDKKLSVLIADDAPSDDAVPATTLMPSLIGKMTNFNGLVVCKGCWAMSDAAHVQPGQTSEFEFKLVKHNEDSLQFPFSGKYHGWFLLKQPQPLKGSLKVEDKDMELTFSGGDNDTNFRILGQGHNKFGSFNLHGTLTQGGDVHLYREYYNLAPLSTPHSKRKQSFSGEMDSNGKKKSHSGTKLKVEQQLAGGGSNNGVVAATADLDLSSPPLVRESSGRVRKMSSLMKEYEDTHATTSSSSSSSGAKSTSTPKHAAPGSSGGSSTSKAASSAVAPAASKESSSDRVQRLSGPLKKCGELLKEVSKHPQAVWFLEPVDYVKFNIPDYPNIIKQPMDFRTIRQALEAVKYDSHEAFAEHMRLVFRNAMTFNQMRDNPVHIAAREMSARFEDRFRQLTTQMAVYNNGAAVDSIPELKRQTSTASSHYGGAGRPSIGKKKPHSGSSSGSKQGSAPGPRPAPVAGYLPVAGDSSSHQIMEMQRMMQAMQEEISALRSAVRENEIVKRLNETKDAAHNPLTFDEKKKLIAQIHKLPAVKMEQVLEIIQAAIPKNENGETDGDIEVPLDALDTFTLRKLQRFIEDNTVRKRPSSSAMASGAPTLQRQSSNASGRGEPTAKKPRKSMPKSGAALMNSAAGGGGGDMGMFDHEELLFSTDCFDDIRGGGGGVNSSSEQADLQEQDYPFDSEHQHHQSFQQQQQPPMATVSAEPQQQGQGRPRAGSLDEDFEDLMEMRSPESSNHGPPAATLNNIAVNNADAWVASTAADNFQESGATADSTADDGDCWGAAQQEVLARQAREQEGPQQQF